MTTIANVMPFTNEESKAFWPIYREYDAELSKIGDARIPLIKDYVQNYETITDGKAKELIRGALKLDERTITLKKRYFRRFDRVLPSKTVAKFLQLENRIHLMIDLQIASQLPLIT